MKKCVVTGSFFSLQLLLAVVLCLPGCFGGETKEEMAAGAVAERGIEDGSPVLLSIDGKARITQNSLEKEFNAFIDENPQLKQVLPYMPDAKQNFFQGLLAQEIVDEYVKRNKIDKTPAYIKEREITHKRIDQILNNKYFSEKHPATVSDAEVRAFYDENKDKKEFGFMISQGGVQAEGVSFANEDDAKAFLAKAKEDATASLEKIAADAGAGLANNYHDLKMVNAQSVGIEPGLITKVISIKRFPSDEFFKVGDKWWVVRAHEKKEAEYRPFEQIKPNLEEGLKKQKQAEVIEKAIDGLKESYGIEINDEPIRARADAQMPQMPGMPTEIDTEVEVKEAPAQMA